MSDIKENLEKILAAVYGEEVRGAIYEAIRSCYEDGKAGATDLIARQDIDKVNGRIDNIIASGTPTEGNTELIDIRSGVDGKNYPTAGAAVRGQISQLSTSITDISDEVSFLKYVNEIVTENDKKIKSNIHYIYGIGIDLTGWRIGWFMNCGPNPHQVGLISPNGESIQLRNITTKPFIYNGDGYIIVISADVDEHVTSDGRYERAGVEIVVPHIFNDIATELYKHEKDIVNHSDLIASISSVLELKQDAVVEFNEIAVSITDGIYSSVTKGAQFTDRPTYKHVRVDVSPNEKYRITGTSWGANNQFKGVALFDLNNNLIATPYETEHQNATLEYLNDYEVTIPIGVASMYVNTNKTSPVVKKAVVADLDNHIEKIVVTEIEKTGLSIIPYDNKQLRHSMYNEDKKNPFAWKSFDKAYFSWTNDDGRSDMYLYQDLCQTFGFPYCPAISYDIIPQNPMINGISLVDRCKTIVANGGEILMHSSYGVTKDSTDADWLSLFRDGKKAIEDAIGCKCTGIIVPGVEGWNTIDYKLAQEYSLMYYEYSDKFGISPNYTLNRTRFAPKDGFADEDTAYAKYVQYIDDAVTNHKWLRFYCHGTDEVSISLLTRVFNYIKTKVDNGQAEFVTWKYMYDNFRSSELEQRLDALAN